MPKLYFLLVSLLKNDSSFNSDLLPFLPRSYKRVGHFAIFNFHESLSNFHELIASALLTLLQPSIRTIARFVKPISGVTRKPTIEYLAGSTDRDTIHIEHNTKFFINPFEIMLSSGNHFERKRLITFVNQILSESVVIVDMFTCIGNLSLPVIVNSSQTRFYFLEINPRAISYLKKSLTLNKIDSSRYTIFEGDNRLTCPKNVADVVIMGFFGIDTKQLECAISSLRESLIQGWIFIHDIGSISATSAVLEEFKALIKKHPFWELEKVTQHNVKSIGPSFEHWVFDCQIIKKDFKKIT
jgi:tRNA G37 N-methylase Trm5